MHADAHLDSGAQRERKRDVITREEGDVRHA
jgi:hypothetical protein